MVTRPDVRDPGLVRGLQERAARALPAEHVERLGTWSLRHSPGCAWWVGSVLPHGDDAAGELPAMVAAAERFCASHGTAAVFQVCPGACPAALDAFLQDRGYRRHTPMSLQAAAVTDVLAACTAPASGDAPAAVPCVRVEDRPGDAWWTVWGAGIHHGEGATRASEEALLARVASPSAFASATLGGRAVSIARAVADTGWAGVFDVVTLPHARGRGAARAVLAALTGWAAAQGCAGLYLQVERDNAAALRLYGRAGFGEAGRYHYRALT
jgi:N-acetylglutamate synthase